MRSRIMSNIAETNLSIDKLVKWLSYGKKIHICIHYLSGAFQNEKSFHVQSLNEIHSCTFCNAAKMTAKGLTLCLENKSLSIRKAIQNKQMYFGQCYLGVTEIVKPVFFDKKPFCIIYLGNLLMDENKHLTKRKISKATKITGIEEKVLLGLLDTLESVNMKTLEEYTEIIEIISASMKLLILNYIKDINKAGYQENTVNMHWIVKQALNYIDQNYYTDIKLRHISRLFFINEQYLCRCFSKNVGVSFSVHLNKVRIDNAMKLLSTTGKTITDIAEMVGFNNVTYFVSTFKRYTGLTPGEYRRNAISYTENKDTLEKRS